MVSAEARGEVGGEGEKDVDRKEETTKEGWDEEEEADEQRQAQHSEGCDVCSLHSRKHPH